MRRIVILANRIAEDGLLEGTVCFRLDVPPSLVPYKTPDQTIQSLVPDCTPEELAALQAGTLKETVGAGKMPPETPSALIEAALLGAWQTAQDSLNATAPAKRYTASSYDDTAPGTWSGMPA